MDQQTNEKSVLPSCFHLSERYDRYNGPIKKVKATTTCLKKKKVFKDRPSNFEKSSSNTRLQFQIGTRKIERGIAVAPCVLVSTRFSHVQDYVLVIPLEGQRLG